MSLAVLGATAAGALAVAVYARGAGTSRRRTYATLFVAGVAAAVAAVGPPLDGLAHRSFAAHMMQHLVLILVAPLLVTASRPAPLMFLGLPKGLRRSGTGRAMRYLGAVPALVVVCVHGLAMWVWHAPPAFEAALRSPAIHALEHVSLFATAVWFWTALLRKARSSGASALYAFATAAHSGLLAALITFSTAPWYETYTRTALPWGLTPTTDQQLAGVLMWVPAGIAYMAAGVVLFVRWLDTAERRYPAEAVTRSARSPSPSR